MPVSKKPAQIWFGQETGRGKNDPDRVEAAVTQDHVSGKRTEWKSPIISPDLENERGSPDFPPTVRDAPDEIPLSAPASKPSTSPES
ncbi:MAG: hypothetical protein AUF79_11620 [Crenarchaeota archaeon 13_1_20CM_2_51_8]|nr:MAG: hypothetical protein AUF79_11620 [Crenarchaeota archaeon 13_1_20CM_2_51_8]